MSHVIGLILMLACGSAFTVQAIRYWSRRREHAQGAELEALQRWACLIAAISAWWFALRELVALL